MKFALSSVVWTSAAASWAGVCMNANRFDMATDVLNGKVYAMGGRSIGGRPDRDADFLMTVDTFDGTDWSTAPPMPTSRTGLASSMVDGKIYAIGGRHQESWGSRYLGTMEIFDGTAWSPGPSMGTPRYSLATAVLEDKIIAIGGADDSETIQGIFDLSTVEIFSPAAYKDYGIGWTPGPAMPTPRAGLATIVLNGKIYAMGGYNNMYQRVVSMDTVEIFDGLTWSPGPSMMTKRGGLTASVFNGKIYVMGGDNVMIDHDKAQDHYFNTVEIFDGAAWSAGPTMAVPRSYLGSVVFGGNLYALGGQNEHSGLNMVEVLEPSAKKFVQCNSTAVLV